jgi:hypothetical protein
MTVYTTARNSALAQTGWSLMWRITPACMGTVSSYSLMSWQMSRMVGATRIRAISPQDIVLDIFRGRSESRGMRLPREDLEVALDASVGTPCRCCSLGASVHHLTGASHPQQPSWIRQPRHRSMLKRSWRRTAVSRNRCCKGLSGRGHPCWPETIAV